MIKEQYFPLETNHVNDDNICLLLEDMGWQGYGIYIYLLNELRRRDNYKCDIRSLKSIAKQGHSNVKTVLNVVQNYNLFIIENSNNTQLISSPYLNRVMQNMAINQEKRSKGGKTRAENSLRLPNGQFANDDQLIEENKIEKIKVEKRKEEEKEIKEKEESSFSSAVKLNWENYIDESLKNETWLGLQANNSGLGTYFFKRKQEIFNAFKEHVIAQGKEKTIASLQDAKAYFANFIRKGTKTNKWVQDILWQFEKRKREKDPYRFEQIDPKTGARSYFGTAIPADAPPRPREDSIWDPVLYKWVKY